METLPGTGHQKQELFQSLSDLQKQTETVPVSVSVSGGLVTLSLDSMQARPIGKTGRLSEPWLRAADLLANKLVCQHELGQKQIS